MRILFIGYWNIDDPLTHATIVPHLKILKKFTSEGTIIFVNTQREKVSAYSETLIQELGISYYPLFSKSLCFQRLTKLFDFIFFPRKIKRIIHQNNIDLVVARGAPAGSLAYLATKKINVNFIVESYEPHADYMLASGTWMFYDLRYIYQKYWEGKQKRHAKALITVSHNYKSQLEKEGVFHEKIYVNPCSVDAELFFPNVKIKGLTRNKLEIADNAIVGVYAGKFGGLYYDKEAFVLFKEAFIAFDSSFHLLLLTNTKVEFLRKRLAECGLPIERCTISFASHVDMPNYLNAADFAFAPTKKSPFSGYLSPVKIGEYLACGLPIIMTEGIGDDASYLEDENAGILIRSFDKKHLSEIFIKLKILLQKDLKNKYYDLAKLKRSSHVVEKIYDQLFSDVNK